MSPFLAAAIIVLVFFGVMCVVDLWLAHVARLRRRKGRCNGL